MLPLVTAFGERRVLEALASEARRPRRKLIRTWTLWAEIIREALVAAPAIAPPPPGDEEITFNAGRKATAKTLEFHIRRWAKDPDKWPSLQLGVPPDESPTLRKFAAERGIELPEAAH